MSTEHLPDAIRPGQPWQKGPVGAGQQAHKGSGSQAAWASASKLRSISDSRSRNAAIEARPEPSPHLGIVPGVSHHAASVVRLVGGRHQQGRLWFALEVLDGAQFADVPGFLLSATV